MPNVGAEFKGKAKQPSFIKPAPAAPKQPKESHWPLLIGGALAGAAVLLYLRSRSSSGTTGQGNVLTVYPSGMADTSQILNMQGTVNAIAASQNTGASQTALPTPDSQNSVPIGGNPADQTSGGVATPKPSYGSDNIVLYGRQVVAQYGAGSPQADALANQSIATDVSQKIALATNNGDTAALTKYRGQWQSLPTDVQALAALTPQQAVAQAGG